MNIIHDTLRAGIFIKEYLPDDNTGRVVFLKSMLGFLTDNVPFALKADVEYHDHDESSLDVNEETFLKIYPALQKDNINSISVFAEDMISHPCLQIFIHFYKKANDRHSKYLDSFELCIPKNDSDFLYGRPDLLLERIKDSMDEINIQYAYIDRFPIDADLKPPYIAMHMGYDRLIETREYMGNHVAGYYWFQILNNEHMEIIDGTGENPSGLMIERHNGNNVIVKGSEDISEMDGEKYLAIYNFVKPLLPERDRLSLSLLIQGLHAHKGDSLRSFLEKTKLYWHRIDEYRGLIELFDYIAERKWDFLNDYNQVVEEMTRRGFKAQ